MAVRALLIETGRLSARRAAYAGGGQVAGPRGARRSSFTCATIVRSDGSRRTRYQRVCSRPSSASRATGVSPTACDEVKNRRRDPWFPRMRRGGLERTRAQQPSQAPRPGARGAVAERLSLRRITMTNESPAGPVDKHPCRCDRRVPGGRRSRVRADRARAGYERRGRGSRRQPVAGAGRKDDRAARRRAYRDRGHLGRRPSRPAASCASVRRQSSAALGERG